MTFKGLAAAIGISLLIFWTLMLRLANNWILARRYRRIRRESPGGVVGIHEWVVVYKEGNKTKTVNVKGLSQGDALLQLIRQRSLRYDNIVSLERVGL